MHGRDGTIVHMEYWLFLPQSRMSIDQIVGMAQTAESSGYAGIALIDHLVTPMAEHQPLYEAITMTTWIAAHTTTLKLGHLVLCDAMRHPATLAKQAVTLDHLSGGRFELGIGWGSWPRELVGFGVTQAEPRERAQHLVDSVGKIRKLWAGEAIVPDGPTQQPLPLGRLPIVVGGIGPTALGLAREHADWWNITLSSVDRLPELRGQVAPARVSAQVMVALDKPGDSEGSALEKAQRNFPSVHAGIFGGAPAKVREEIEALDVERVYIWLAPPPDTEAVLRFADLVMDRA